MSKNPSLLKSPAVEPHEKPPSLAFTDVISREFSVLNLNTDPQSPALTDVWSREFSVLNLNTAPQSPAFTDVWSWEFSVENTWVTVLGACCYGDASCDADQTSGSCDRAGGIYQGDNLQCSAVICKPFGACCFEDYTCQERLTANECLAQFGDPQTPGTTCSTSLCVPPGIPTVSEWGLIVMALLLLAAGSIVLRRVNIPAPLTRVTAGRGHA